MRIPKLERINRSKLFLAVALLVSVFTSFYNILEFPSLTYDEGSYLGKAMYFLTTHNPQERSNYFNPYFGQIFLGGILWLAGYSDSSQILANSNLVASVESLWFVPRLLTGIMSIIDVFLVYKISERRYNVWVAFIAAILFALLPIAWFLRIVFLESIQLPLVLSSVLLALYANDTQGSITNNRKTCLVALSGVLMGLAIFTKISVFSMIPLFAFIFWTTRNEKLKSIGLWLIPVILIPLIWPAYAILHGDFDRWWDGIYWQSHRQTEDINFMQIGKQNTLPNAISLNFYKIPILIAVGFAGLVYLGARKDFFLLLWAVPFLLFLLLIGFAREFHLIPLLPILSISAARFIEGIIGAVAKKKIYDIALVGIISAVAIFGLTNSPLLFSSNQINSDIIEATAVIIWYLMDNPNNSTTMISNHVYSWIPKYVLNQGNQFLIPEISDSENPQHEKVLLVADRSFMGTMSGKDAVGRHLHEIYDKNIIKNISTVYFGEYRVILPEDWPRALEQRNGINLLDRNHSWNSGRNANISQSENDLKIISKTNRTESTSSHALLTTKLGNVTGSPVLLNLNYASNSTNTNTKYFVELVDSENQNMKFWRYDLENTSGNYTNGLFIIPEESLDRELKFRLGILTKSPGEHLLSIQRATVVFPK